GEVQRLAWFFNSPTQQGVAFSSRGRSKRKRVSAMTRRSQPVDATLYLRGKRWSVGWNEDFIEVLLRQRRRSYGIAGSAGSRRRRSGELLVRSHRRFIFWWIRMVG